MSPVNWIAVEGDFRAGTKSLRAMAAYHNTSVASIRRKAEKMGWIRDPTGTKRRIVADRLAGLSQDPAQCAMVQIEDAAAEDVSDMQQGLEGYRNILRAMVKASREVEEPRDAKVIAEALDKAVTGIRTIRGLDDPSIAKAEELDAEIEAELSKLNASKEARAAQAVA